MSKSGQKPVSPKVVALQESMRRRRGVRDLQKRFLIVCEDGKSAPNYFEALKKYENLSAASIAVFGSDGNTQPIQVVEAAIRRKKAASDKDSGTAPFDHVWCAIDGDYGAAINNARVSAKANGIKLAVTTMCFEYWVLLHFEQSAKATADCAGVIRSLKHAHLPRYSKGACDFSKIVPRARTASDRAEKLRQKNILPENQNPCSDVYLLISAILNAAPTSTATPAAPQSPRSLTQQSKSKGRGRNR